ncbi:MAG TPA: hypothetical protein VEQ11_19800 [Chloroflexota bacterium]|nr:hypothetical protein [Chloroflexota bacterium]
MRTGYQAARQPDQRRWPFVGATPLVAAALALWLSSPAGVRSEPAPAETPRALQESGDLQALVIAYKGTLPDHDSHAFVEPEPGEAVRFLAATTTALGGDLDDAASRFDTFGYDLVSFLDLGSSVWHLVLRERTPCGRCWGLYVLSRSVTARDVAVEAPHPLFDALAPEMAIDAYLRMDAREFSMAGTHRYANGPDSPVSDMARNPNSVFQKMHEALTGPDTQVFQYHGFNLRNHPGYPNVVLSNGSPNPQPELFLLKAAIEARGETVGIFDGRDWGELGATINPQGRYTRSIGGRFFHMEHEFAIRSDPARRAAMVDAALEALFSFSLDAPPATVGQRAVACLACGRGPD